MMSSKQWRMLLLLNFTHGLRLRRQLTQGINSEAKAEVQADEFNIMNVPDEIDTGSFYKRPKEINAIQQYEAMMGKPDPV